MSTLRYNPPSVHLAIGETASYERNGFKQLAQLVTALTADAKNLQFNMVTDPQDFKRSKVSVTRLFEFSDQQPTVSGQKKKFDAAITLSKYSGIEPSCIVCKLLLMAKDGETCLNVIHPEQLQRALQALQMLKQLQIPGLVLGTMKTHAYCNTRSQQEYLQFFFSLKYE